MNALKRTALAAAALACGLWLTGCQTDQQAAKPAPAETPPAPVVPAAPPAPPPETPEQLAEKAARAAAEAERDSVVTLYNNGDYRGAIKRGLAVQDDLKIYKDLELETIKYTAFSYCLSGNTRLCRGQFEKAFKLDSTFTLEAGEIGHPMWWPAFQQAKKQAGIK